MRAPEWASEMEGIAVMPRERQLSPKGAQTATRARIKYWRGENEWWDIGSFVVDGAEPIELCRAGGVLLRLNP
jgi:hypothetical protein